ncbi:MAG TPA: FAD-binding and (Fe-S)-binding domain-containing protein [Alloacidobacterium sp.]|nr:FAD-binding and (Fe-S)-binding domain-containing protein [Alloacidobacterium sp.]
MQSLGLSSKEIALQLGLFMEPARILTRAIDRIAFASDASFYRQIPQAVVQPLNIQEVRDLFGFSRETRIPLTFRAGGTSLSGQSITDGILVDVSRYWRKGKVEENGRALRAQSGLTGQQANNLLRPYGVKIGPDPASMQVAQIGGILSNNASGMCCGVAHNAYHTVRSLTFLLPSGTLIDTASPDANTRFIELEPRLTSGLLEIREHLVADAVLVERIRSKYRMKNTVGYSLNAFLDYSTPVDIFSHLLIGAEGTLGFIAEAVLETIEELPAKYTGLLLFPDLHSACAAIAPLRDVGATALELMDRAALRSVQEKPGVPAHVRQLPGEACALLAEFQSANGRESKEKADDVQASLGQLNLLHEPMFTYDPTERERLWHIRKGLFPSVGAARAAGTTVIIEDVAFPIDHLADAAIGLRRLFATHGYDNAIIFGHAKDGNLHFVISQGFNTEEEISRYRRFIDDLVHLVVTKYQGALKAEHGTGRNMAPFVETEWGSEAYAAMRHLKRLVDPENLLNPGVILNSDPEAHISNLKDLPQVEDEIDKCIECGYCEPKCPSRDLTLTPRQRIVVRREMERSKNPRSDRAMYAALEQDFPYMVLDTCAVDGMCAIDCPVGIDTGNLTKRFRQLRHSAFANRIAIVLAKKMVLTERLARFSLAAGHAVSKLCGSGCMSGITHVLDRIFRAVADEAFWQWCAEMPESRRGPIPSRTWNNADAVYFVTCISRIMGGAPGEQTKTNLIETLIALADRAGVNLVIPDSTGSCCGVPFSSKGFTVAHRVTVERTIHNLFRWSREGRVPIVVDNSPCSYGLKTARPYLSPQAQTEFDKLSIIDSIEFAHDWLVPKLRICRKAHSVVLHPVCSAVKMDLTAKLVRIAKACSEDVLVPRDAGCCAFAGDRGFLFPELTASATRLEALQANQQKHDGYFSSSRTCEIGMTRATGRPYRSFLHLLDCASRPDDCCPDGNTS